MKLTYLSKSTSAKGGWILETTHKRQLDQLLRTLKTGADYYFTRMGRVWVTDTTLDLIGQSCDNFPEMASRVGYVTRQERERRAKAEQERRSQDQQRHRQRQQSDTPPPTSSGPYAVLFLTANAPSRVVQAVYRELAKAYHPDLGGDLAKMKALNVAYETIMSEPRRADYAKRKQS